MQLIELLTDWQNNLFVSEGGDGSEFETGSYQMSVHIIWTFSEPLENSLQATGSASATCWRPPVNSLWAKCVTMTRLTGVASVMFPIVTILQLGVLAC